MVLLFGVCRGGHDEDAHARRAFIVPGPSTSGARRAASVGMLVTKEAPTDDAASSSAVRLPLRLVLLLTCAK